MERYFGCVEIRTTGAKLKPAKSEKANPLWVYRQTGLIPIKPGEENLPGNELILRKIVTDLPQNGAKGNVIELPCYRFLMIILARAQYYLLQDSQPMAVSELFELGPPAMVTPLIEAASTETSGNCLNLIWRRTKAIEQLPIGNFRKPGVNEINRRKIK